MKMLPLAMVVALCGSAASVVTCPALAQSPSAYTLTRSVALGAPDRWDYVSFEVRSGRVFVAHGDRLTVVDGQSGAILGEVTGFPGGTHGIAFSPSGGKGYTDDGASGTIGIFDLKSLKTLKRIKGVEDADGIATDPVTGKVFVVNGDSKNVSVVDPATEAVVATIELGGKLEFAVADGAGKLFVNGAEKSELARIDTATNAVDARWSIASCTSPHGLGMDTQSRRLFVSCTNNLLLVVNADSGAVVASLPIGAGSDAVAFDPVRKRIFSSNGRDGTISVYEERSADHYVALPTIRTTVSAKTMALDPRSGRLYVAAGEQEAQAPGAKGKAKIVPGSFKLLFIDPAP